MKCGAVSGSTGGDKETTDITLFMQTSLHREQLSSVRKIGKARELAVELHQQRMTMATSSTFAQTGAATFMQRRRALDVTDHAILQNSATDVNINASVAERVDIKPSLLDGASSRARRGLPTGYIAAIASAAVAVLVLITWCVLGFVSIPARSPENVMAVPQQKMSLPTSAQLKGPEATNIESPQLEQKLLQESSTVSPLFATGLLVQNQSGVHVRLLGTLAPQPERKDLQLVSLRGKRHKVVLSVVVDEIGTQPGIRVTSASGIAVAFLDTNRAIYQPGGQPSYPQERCAIVHRVSGNTFEHIGPPCVWIRPNGDSTMSVHQHSEHGDVAITVHVKPGGLVNFMTDANSKLVANATLNGATWVGPGVDIVLVACVLLAAEKLA